MTLNTGRMDIALDAALGLAAEKDWAEISLAEIARACHKTLADFYGEVDKDGLMDELDQRLDKACCTEPVDSGATLRERVFDVAMLRFEAMEDHRDAILSMRNSWKRDPARRLKAAKRRLRTARWILTCAEADGPALASRSVLLSAILFRAEEAWSKETSPDFTRTMAQLDRDLRDANQFAERLASFGGVFRKSAKKEAAGEPAAF